MSATPVSKKELVRLLVIEHGQKRAAELSGEPYEKVRKWTQRGNWLASQTVPETVTATVDHIVSDLAEHEKETRLSLAKSARRMAKDAEECTLRDADKALKVGQLAGIVHKWNDGQKGESFSLNVLNMGALEVRVGKEAQDIDQTISG